MALCFILDTMDRSLKTSFLLITFGRVLGFLGRGKSNTVFGLFSTFSYPSKMERATVKVATEIMIPRIIKMESNRNHSFLGELKYFLRKNTEILFIVGKFV